MKGRPPPVPRDSVVLTGSDLSLEDLGRVAYDRELEVRLSDEAEDAVNRSRDYVESLLGEGGQIYGVTTGFGRLAEVVIPADKRETLQANLIRSHSAGVGELLSMEEVRAIMVLRANALSRGHSGCRLVVVKRLLECLNAGLHPAVPGYGSVGASGDLAPLAHIALAILGEGTVEYQGSLRPTGDVLK
ncbi:MAG: aromatic amino acid lyase, partial [Gemmatimonadetes bacterium]|nr:aromatic amino acid lyase [Gemmatimonadota bacterium]